MVGMLGRAEGDMGEAGPGLISHQEGVLVLQDHRVEWLPLPLGAFSAGSVAWGWSGAGLGTDPGWGRTGQRRGRGWSGWREGSGRGELSGAVGLGAPRGRRREEEEVTL